MPLFTGMIHRTMEIKVEIDENANDNKALAIDLIVISDEKLLDKLLAMPSKEWFEKREQLKRDYLNGPYMEYYGWEWVPGQIVPDQNVDVKTRSLAALIYVNYTSPGSHRFRIDPFSDIIIHLRRSGFTVKTL